MQTIEQKVERNEERIDHLDAVLGQFIAVTGAALTRLEREMKDFKDEMKDFKDEMKDFKVEMKEYKDWSKANIENMNRQWGNLARKMGTLVEDIFYPSSEIVIEKYFQMKPSSIASRKISRKDGDVFEADILAVCGKEKTAFLFEIKSNPNNNDNIIDFKERVARAPEFFEEIKGLKLVPIYGGISINEATLKTLTKEGIYGIIFKGDILEIPNFEEVGR